MSEKPAIDPLALLQRRQQQLRARGLLDDNPNATEAPPSPCIQVCTMTAADAQTPAHCQGCWRTLDEIASWSQATPTQKRAIWRALLQRALGG